MTDNDTGGDAPDPPRRTSHLARNVNLSIAAAMVLVLTIVIAIAATSGTKPKSVAGTAAGSNVLQPATQRNASPSQSPSPSPASSGPQTLKTFSGSGIDNSTPFDVGDGPLTIQYSYDCSSFGSSGNFIADLLHGKKGRPYSDDQAIANDLGPGGNDTATVNPVFPGVDYYLSVTSECRWSITVTSG